MSSSQQLVLITGATGHVGFKVLLDTLNLGYRTRLAVRSDSKKDVILSNKAFKALNAADRVEFAIVPDLTVEGAYDQAVKGVDFIIHIASPITSDEWTTNEQFQEHLIKPAVEGTMGIFDSTLKNGSKVQRIIVTSSIVAQVNLQALIGQDGGAIKTASSRAPNDNGPYHNVFHAYSASKIASLNALESWVKAKSPSFDVVTVHPAFIEGRNELITSAKAAFSGTNAVVLGIASGSVRDSPLPGATVHLDDVSRVHVGALDKSKIPAGSYIAQWNPEGTSKGTTWADVTTIVEKEFPAQVKSGLLKPGPIQATSDAFYDSSETEKVYGFKFLNLEEQVKSVVGQYVELAEASA